MEKVRQIIRYAAEHASFYKELFLEAEVDVTVDFDFEDIPFTIWQDIISRGSEMICIPEREIVCVRNRAVTEPEFIYDQDLSAGMKDRTIACDAPSDWDEDGGKAVIPFSIDDVRRQRSELIRLFEAAIAPESKLMVLLPHVRPYDAGYLVCDAAEAAGLHVKMPGSPGRLPSYNTILDLIYDEGYTNIFGTQNELFDIMKYTTRPDLDNVFMMGDIFSASIEKSLADTWGCRIYRIYRMPETGDFFAAGLSRIGTEYSGDDYGELDDNADLDASYDAPEGIIDTEHPGSGYFPSPEFLIEIIDAETGWPLKEGRLGEIVITTLEKRAMPLIRYRTGYMSRMKNGRLDRIGPLEDFMRFNR